MNLLIGKDTPNFAKDTVYRFMKMLQINWLRFTTILSSRIIKDAIVPLDSEDRVNVLIIDDSMFERNSSKKVELLAKVYDHAKHWDIEVFFKVCKSYLNLSKECRSISYDAMTALSKSKLQAA